MMLESEVVVSTKEQAQQGYSEPLWVHSQGEFEKKFGRLLPGNRIGAGSIAEVYKSETRPDVVLKFISYSNGVQHAVAEAIAFARTERQKLKGKNGSITTEVPIASIQYSFSGGVVIALPRVNGQNWNEVIRQRVFQINLASKKALQAEAARELVYSIATSHAAGVAIRDIKLDGLLVQQTDVESFSATLIDMNAAVIIPEVSAMISAEKKLAQLYNLLSISTEISADGLRRGTKQVEQIEINLSKLSSYLFSRGPIEKPAYYTYIALEINRLLSALQQQLQSVTQPESKLDMLQPPPSYSLFSSISLWLKGRSAEKEFHADMMRFYDLAAAQKVEIQEKLAVQLNAHNLASQLRAGKSDEMMNQILRSLGISDTRIVTLLEMDDLKSTYLDEKTAEVLRMKLQRAIDAMRTSLHNRRGQVSMPNLIQEWYALFQNEATKDWETLVTEVLPQLNLVATHVASSTTQHQEVAENLEKRRQLTSSITAEGSGLALLDKQFQMLDESIGKALLSAIDE